MPTSRKRYLLASAAVLIFTAIFYFVYFKAFAVTTPVSCFLGLAAALYYAVIVAPRDFEMRNLGVLFILEFLLAVFFSILCHVFHEAIHSVFILLPLHLFFIILLSPIMAIPFFAFALAWPFVQRKLVRNASTDSEVLFPMLIVILSYLCGTLWFAR